MRDVDLIVEIASRREYWALQRDLENRGFVQDEDGGVICRWVVAGIPDVMPTDPQILGFSNRWYAPAVRTAETHPLDDVRVRAVPPPYFVATKLEAFADPERGAGDLWASHDIQDIVPAHLPPDDASQRRAGMIVERLQRIAVLAR